MKLPVHRWTKEADHFDRVAREAARVLRPADPETLHRYGQLRRRRFDKEYCFRFLGGLKGKRVLDVGCGDGINSLTLAMLGAEVTGIDISSESIAVAQRRMSINGVSDRVRFICAPLERADIGSNKFDIIWCYAILHHVLPEIETVMSRLVHWAKPGAKFVIVEPINLCTPLRKLRFALFPPSEVTPGERPLEKREIEILMRKIPGLRRRHFRTFSRLDKLILPGGQYETASFGRRLLFDLLVSVDWILLSIPVFSFSAGTAVFTGSVNK